jgi:hypothetical protein
MVAVWLALFICACTGSAGSGLSTSGGPACGSVCKNIATQCGAPLPDCEASCATFSDSTKQCIASATSCSATGACTKAGTSSGSSGGSSSSGGVVQADPCKGCKEGEGCVRDSSVASEKGCFTISACTHYCTCVYRPGGPMLQGSKKLQPQSHERLGQLQLSGFGRVRHGAAAH